MSDTNPFAKLVPGFDFLQGLMKNATGAVPPMGQWVAPTLNPEELEKRIAELKTVKFWLEQNSRMLEATIQALEVQRMTLATLKGMNVQMGELQKAMVAKVPDLGVAAPSPAPSSAAEPASQAKAAAPKPKAKPAAAAAQAAPAAAPGVVDPMQWWGALTKQFSELAGNALKDGGTDMMKNLASAAAASMSPAKDAPAPKPAAKPAAKAAAKKRSSN